MIEIFDYRSDAEQNVVVRPELRGRFLTLQPQPAPPQHSHDIAGESFLVLAGTCEFQVGEDFATVGPGQLIYVDKNVLHTMRAIGGPCSMYLSVTPHVEPTHTFYDQDGDRRPPRYDAWRGLRHPDGSADPGTIAHDPRFDDSTLLAAFVASMGRLAEVTSAASPASGEYAKVVRRALEQRDSTGVRNATDDMWAAMKELLNALSTTIEAWNEVAPHAMDGANPPTSNERTSS